MALRPLTVFAPAGMPRYARAGQVTVPATSAPTAMGVGTVALIVLALGGGAVLLARRGGGGGSESPE